jgi:hypothetical protein
MVEAGEKAVTLREGKRESTGQRRTAECQCSLGKFLKTEAKRAIGSPKRIESIDAPLSNSMWKTKV